jgi:hypothetical protein
MSIWKSPEKIETILGDILSERGYLTICKEYDVVSHWKEIVGEKISKVTECSRVENGILYVKVFSAVWRQEIVYLKPQIMLQIKNQTDCTTITDIVFC